MVASFEITGAAVWPDIKILDMENIENAKIEIGPVNHEYKYGLVDSSEPKIAFASKNRKEWVLALSFELGEGNDVKASDVAAHYCEWVKEKS